MITRESVLKWLDQTSRKQTWLAQQCGVSKQAVSNWLREKNPQSISASAALKIQRLMAEDEAKRQAAQPHNLVLEFNTLENRNIEEAARRRNETRTAWAKRTLNEIAEIEVADLHLKVAEDSGQYKTPKRSGGSAGK